MVNFRNVQVAKSKFSKAPPLARRKCAIKEIACDRAISKLKELALGAWTNGDVR